jgi:hypothetical protein
MANYAANDTTHRCAVVRIQAGRVKAPANPRASSARSRFPTRVPERLHHDVGSGRATS